MNISISSHTIKARKDEYLIRSEVITSFKSLTKRGITLSVTGKGITDELETLLNQEGIILGNHSEADLFIIIENENLKVRDLAQTLFRSDSWSEITKFILTPPRKAAIERTTNETDISVNLNLDGTGKSDISTGLNFFDHMLDQIAKHGLIDLSISCDGDLEVDEHHTIEDVALALGEAISSALGNKKGIERYGFVLPMDEAQATVALDLSGRPYLVFDVPLTREYVGDLPTEMLEHFFYSLAMNLRATIHVTCTGKNDHHKIEACFKGFARALKTAIEQNGRIINQIPSSKGSL